MFQRQLHHWSWRIVRKGGVWGGPISWRTCDVSREWTKAQNRWKPKTGGPSKQVVRCESGPHGVLDLADDIGAGQMVVPHVLGDVVTRRQGELGVAPAVLLHPAQVADMALEAAIYRKVVRSLVPEVAFADEVVVVAGGGELLGEDREVEREEVGAGVGLDVGDVDRVAPRADGWRRLASGVAQRWLAGSGWEVALAVWGGSGTAHRKERRVGLQ